MAPSRISQLSRDGRLPGDLREVYDTAAAQLGKHDFAREGKICRSRCFPFSEWCPDPRRLTLSDFYLFIHVARSRAPFNSAPVIGWSGSFGVRCDSPN